MQTYKYDKVLWVKAKEQVRTILAEIASQRTEKTIYYSDLASKITAIKFHPNDHPFHGLLGQISEEEDAEGRGMLSVLVVSKSGEMVPGQGFFDLAESLGRDVSDKFKLWAREFEAVRAAHQRK